MAAGKTNIKKIIGVSKVPKLPPSPIAPLRNVIRGAPETEITPLLTTIQEETKGTACLPCHNQSGS